MSTFTKVAGIATCDRCKKPAGKTWRVIIQHVCPDLATRINKGKTA